MCIAYTPTSRTRGYSVFAGRCLPAPGGTPSTSTRRCAAPILRETTMMKRLLLASIAAFLLIAGAQAQERKVMRLAFTRAETSMDPAKIVDLYSRVLTAHIFESPITYDHLARPIKFKPSTAEALPEQIDYRVWTMKIKPGIYFSDDPAFKGKKRELVAADYVYAYKRLVDPKNK